MYKIIHRIKLHNSSFTLHTISIAFQFIKWHCKTRWALLLWTRLYYQTMSHSNFRTTKQLIFCENTFYLNLINQPILNSDFQQRKWSPTRILIFHGCATKPAPTLDGWVRDPVQISLLLLGEFQQIYFYSPWIHQKTYCFLMTSGGNRS